MRRADGNIEKITRARQVLDRQVTHGCGPADAIRVEPVVNSRS